MDRQHIRPEAGARWPARCRLPGAGGCGLTGAARAQAAAESTFDRVRRTKVLRIAALPGELPYFQKDLATGEWSGACISMAQDIAKVFDAKAGVCRSPPMATRCWTCSPTRSTWPSR